ncbi:MAG: preprotein translocase subunit SecG [Clostridia bacterium]|nr:preprotein translocase subunit SecG [Clostridia bacterium]
MFGLLMATAADVYNGFSIAFMILMVLSSIAMIIVVLLQRGDASNNMSAITGGSDTFFGRNKSRSIDGKFKLATVIIAASILVFSILFFVFQVLLHAQG